MILSLQWAAGVKGIKNFPIKIICKLLNESMQGRNKVLHFTLSPSLLPLHFLYNGVNIVLKLFNLDSVINLLM